MDRGQLQTRKKLTSQNLKVRIEKIPFSGWRNKDKMSLNERDIGNT
jgi:hypothetical protein